ncbi:MAG TPA: condensation domain-containing protein, partial [Blastocatellia bacterium]|nr:condensation domain-containing protein [Blastocatellia bacterium]
MSELKERLAQLTEEQQRDILAQLSLRSSPKPRNRFPLSSSQRRLWILDQIGAGSSAYKIPLAIRLNGRLNSKALEDSFREVVRRHQSLRTVFETEDSTGETFQVVLGATFYFNTCDLTAIPEPIRADKLKTLVKRIISRSFDLTEGPLIRASLVRTGDREHILVLTMHHIVSDGWSAAILTREVIDLYQAYSKGFPSPLPELPIQYVDFAAWQNKRLEGHYLDEQLEYWKHRLAPPLRALELPTRGLRPDAPTSRVAEIVFQIGSDLTQSLSALSRREGATLFMTLLAAFAVLLYRYTGQEDILIGTPVANRSRREFEGLIGLFINTLTLRLELMQGRTFWAVLAAVKEAALEAYANADIPFETVVEQIGSARDFSRSPAFQVMFALQNTPQQEVRLPDLHLEVVPVEASAAKFDLTVSMAETNAGMSGNWEYNADLFEPSLMERMIGHYVGLLRSLEEHSFDDIAQLPMLSDEEILQL